MKTERGGYFFAKRQKYYDKVIDLYQKGYGSRIISKSVPVCRQTIVNWIATFASENSLTAAQMKSVKPQSPAQDVKDVKGLQKRIKELEAQLKQESLRADFYDEMIKVAESKFNIPIRKKTGAKR